MVIYKYFGTFEEDGKPHSGSHGVSVLNQLQLKVTPPNEFNDPFEFVPHAICSDPTLRIKEILKTPQLVREFYTASVSHGIFVGPFDGFVEGVERNQPKLIAELTPLIVKETKEACRKLLDQVSTTHGLLCLSKRGDSILMWGHYGSSHHGLAIGFESSNWVFSGLDNVRYVDKRVMFDGGWEVRDIRTQKFESEIVFSKNSEWTYEQEVRLFGLLSKFKQQALQKGGIGHFLPFPPEALVSVALGWRCTPELEAKVRAALNKNPALKHVTVQRASLHDSEFKMV